MANSGATPSGASSSDERSADQPAEASNSAPLTRSKPTKAWIAGLLLAAWTLFLAWMAYSD